MKYKKSDVVVYVTTDYDIFEIVPYNRDTRHSAKITKSVESIGSYMDHYPIVVVPLGNGKFAIYDGQGRYKTCVRLGLPVYFIISERLEWEHVSHLNCTVTRWSNQDYMHNYAKQGLKEYIAAERFKEKYPFMSISFIIIFGQPGDGHKAKDDWHNGTWLFSNEEFLTRIAEQAKDFRAFTSAWKDALFHKALRHAINNPGYDHNWVISRLEQGKQLRKRTSIPEYLEELTNVFRWRARGEKASMRLEEVYETTNVANAIKAKRANVEKERLEGFEE